MGVYTEFLVKQSVGDIGIAVQFGVDGESVMLFQLRWRIGERGIECPEQSPDARHRNFPDSEKSEDMVYAVGVEISRHIAETRFPPCVAVGAHAVPVVGGKAPVLTQGREWIRRSARAAVEVEEPAVGPRLHAGARDAYGDVALYSHAACVGIVAGLP